MPYTFSGVAGEVWVFSVYGQPAWPNNLNAAANVYDPAGKYSLAYVVNGQTAPITLTNTGIHTVVVSADDLNHMGSYSLSASLVKPVPGTYRLGINTTNGAAVLNLWGQLGLATTIQYTTNVADTNMWPTLTNFTLPWSPYRLVHQASTNSPQGFYRFFQKP